MLLFCSCGCSSFNTCSLSYSATSLSVKSSLYSPPTPPPPRRRLSLTTATCTYLFMTKSCPQPVLRSLALSFVAHALGGNLSTHRGCMLWFPTSLALYHQWYNSNKYLYTRITITIMAIITAMEWSEIVWELFKWKHSPGPTDSNSTEEKKNTVHFIYLFICRWDKHPLADTYDMMAQ